MYLYFCSLCLNNNKNLKSVLIEDNDGVVVDTKIKYCLSGIIDMKPEVPKYICSMCLKNINCFYKFKQNCLQNNTLLNDYFRNLKISAESYENLSVKLTDIIPKSKLQATSLPVEVTYGINITPETKQNTVDSIPEEDNEEIDNVAKEEIEVKEEFVTTADQYNFEFVDCIKSEPEQENNIPEMSITLSDPPTQNTNQSEISNSTEMTVTVQSKVKKHTFKLFKCTICNREFVHHNSLKYHLQTHADIKNFQCSICSKKFRCKSHLVQHENSHTGVKEYKCTICEKSFSYKCSLMSHLKTHDGVKKYKCAVCQKKFIHKVHLTQHEKIHTGVKEFECPLCHKQFISKAHMLRHKRIHNSIKYSEFVKKNLPVIDEINNC